MAAAPSTENCPPCRSHSRKQIRVSNRFDESSQNKSTFILGSWVEGLLPSLRREPPLLIYGSGSNTETLTLVEAGKGPAPRTDPTARHFSPLLLGTDWKLPIPLGPVYPPLISSLSTTKAVGRNWDLTPLMAKSLRIPDVSLPRVPTFPYPLHPGK